MDSVGGGETERDRKREREKTREVRVTALSSQRLSSEIGRADLSSYCIFASSV